MARPKRVPARPVNPRGAVNAVVPDHLWVLIQAEAQRRQVSMSAVVRWALEVYFERGSTEPTAAAS